MMIDQNANVITSIAAIPRPKNTDLIDEKEATEFLGVKPGTLSVWRSTGRYGIPFLKVGRLVRYRRSDLAVWLDSRTRTTGATV